VHEYSVTLCPETGQPMPESVLNQEERREVARRVFFPQLLILLLAIVVIIMMVWIPLAKQMALNRAAVWTMRALAQGESEPAMHTASKALTTAEGCSIHWFRGLLAHAMGDKDARDRAWVQAMRCSPHYVRMASAMLPDRQSLAELAVLVQPDDADTWLWLARVHSQKDPQTAIELYRRGLALRPTDGEGWQELGELLASQDPQAAIVAFLQCCYNGDPGYNGCWRAGQTAEQLGDIQAAIHYYRLSDWSGALERARQLEQKRIQ
jgi:tetratricopeptide (TPR) repeat protein